MVQAGSWNISLPSALWEELYVQDQHEQWTFVRSYLQLVPIRLGAVIIAATEKVFI